MEERKFDIEDRLIAFCCCVIDLVDALPATRAGNYIAAQLIRCCHSPAFNYGEAQAAGSRNDFIHKMSICLKELKECRTALKIIQKKEMIKQEKLLVIYKEAEELVAIFAKSIETAKKKLHVTINTKN